MGSMILGLGSNQGELDLTRSELPTHQDFESRLVILREFVEREKELPGCCFIDLPNQDSSLRIAVDMRGNLTHIVVGCPGEIWLTLNKEGEVTSILGAIQGANQRILSVQGASREEKERAVSILIATIEEQGRFVSIAEIRRESTQL